jgi:cytochrome c oxidase assembly factor CtaG
MLASPTATECTGGVVVMLASPTATEYTGGVVEMLASPTATEYTGGVVVMLAISTAADQQIMVVISQRSRQPVPVKTLSTQRTGFLSPWLQAYLAYFLMPRGTLP